MAVLTSITGFLAGIGAAVIGLCWATGALLVFAGLGVANVFTPPWYPAELGRTR